jgi:hypothetical protein
MLVPIIRVVGTETDMMARLCRNAVVSKIKLLLRRLAIAREMTPLLCQIAVELTLFSLVLDRTKRY